MKSAEAWNRIVGSFSITHVLQTWQWGMVKERFGWEILPQTWKDGNKTVAAALVLRRKIKMPFLGRWGCILYVPKGPLLKSWDDLSLVQQVLGNLEALAHEQRAILIKIDPDIEFCRGENTLPWNMNIGEKRQTESVICPPLAGGNFLGESIVSLLQARGWTFSREQVQFRNTAILNLTLSEDELLMRMKQKTRYNIRLAERKGVNVREGNVEDIPMLYRMYQETARRDGFIIRDEEYYKTTWRVFLDNRRFSSSKQDVVDSQGNFTLPCEPFAHILIAEYEGEPLAGIVLFVFRDKAWYMYGMSTEKHREKMPNYLLHWRAIQYLRQIGVEEYDLWGAPDRFEESDPMYGVYRFKVGFGAETVQHIGAWDYPVSSAKYYLYQEILPRYLSFLRKQRRRNL